MAVVSPLACQVDERSVRALDEAESGGAGSTAVEAPDGATSGAAGAEALPAAPPSAAAEDDATPLPAAATLRADASVLAFPSVEVGTPGAELRWTITRAGGGSAALPLVVESTNTDDFTVRGSCAPLGADGSCSLSVQFNPQAGGE
ncbi:MAG TPA: hypothetical protein VMG12_32815, partial [Polyangiaceae bacterium]|nr:hypothetical protein [Polyangiaceae bacterium]